MSVREGRPADLSHLLAIQSATLAEPWPELLETAVAGPPPLFVVTDPAPVGYAAVVPGGESVAYVPELAVDPDHQRAGHGSRLLDRLREQYVAAGGQLRLVVRVNDRGARSFYADHGFETVERLDGYFEGCDGLVLALSTER
jgi:ribosomal-protein-alanine N-acetyltransferase